MAEQELQQDEQMPKTIAAIDIGANAIRFIIAEAFPDGKVNVLEQLTRGVWLGKDTFQRGVLGAKTMRAGIDVLRQYRHLLDQYSVEHVRAVATAAIREAANADIFIDRIRLATGIEVELIDPAEEVLYTVLAVQDSFGKNFKTARKNILFVEVGGGNTLCSILRNGSVINSQSLNIGSIRLSETIAEMTESSTQNLHAMMRHEINDVLDAAEPYFPLEGNDYFLAMGGATRLVAQQVGTHDPKSGMLEVSLKNFDAFVNRCLKMETSDICHRFGIPFQTAETLKPALLTYQEILRRSNLDSFLVSSVSMRHGLLAALAREVWGLENTYFHNEVLESAKSLAKRFHVDIPHAWNTMLLAARLFDEMQAEHGLHQRYRLLLQVAAVLQTSGKLVSNRSFHKHSYYLISNSEIFGLRQTNTEMAALISRYSNRSMPKPSHSAFMVLPSKHRVIILKLAALLRVADALNNGECPPADQIHCEMTEDEWIVYMPPCDDFLLKCRVLESRVRLFEDVFGMRVRFEIRMQQS